MSSSPSVDGGGLGRNLESGGGGVSVRRAPRRTPLLAEAAVSEHLGDCNPMNVRRAPRRTPLLAEAAVAEHLGDCGGVNVRAPRRTPLLAEAAVCEDLDDCGGVNLSLLFRAARSLAPPVLCEDQSRDPGGGGCFSASPEGSARHPPATDAARDKIAMDKYGQAMDNYDGCNLRVCLSVFLSVFLSVRPYVCLT